MNVREYKQRVSQPNDVGVGPEGGVTGSQDALQESRPHQHLGLEYRVAVSAGGDRVLSLLRFWVREKRRREAVHVQRQRKAHVRAYTTARGRTFNTKNWTARILESGRGEVSGEFTVPD